MRKNSGNPNGVCRYVGAELDKKGVGCGGIKCGTSGSWWKTTVLSTTLIIHFLNKDKN